MIPCPGCQRYVLEHETSCPFCDATLRAEPSPLRTNLEAFAVAAAIALGSIGCATNPSAETSEGNTTTTQGATETSGTTSDTFTTQGSTTSEGTGEETDDPPDTSLAFYAPASDIIQVSECDPFMQDCPEGEKCVAYASTGGTWDANKCVMILGDGATGEPCTYGGRVDATDDCDADNVCFYVNGDAGVCTAFCIGTADDPLCDDGFSCLITAEGSINLCLQDCDPLAQDCADPLACVWIGAGFTCAAPDPGSPLGEACNSPLACEAGTLCINGEFLPGCTDDACCGQICDTSNVDFECADPDTLCVPFFEGEPPEGYESVGVCIADPP